RCKKALQVKKRRQAETLHKDVTQERITKSRDVVARRLFSSYMAASSPPHCPQYHSVGRFIVPHSLHLSVFAASSSSPAAAASGWGGWGRWRGGRGGGVGRVVPNGADSRRLVDAGPDHFRPLATHSGPGRPARVPLAPCELAEHPTAWRNSVSVSFSWASAS